MNKTTTLVLAAIAGFGLCAQARTSTNELWDVNFSGVTVPEGGVTNLVDVPEASFTDGSWAVQPDDESCVTNGVGLSGSLSNLLELNTQGNDLTWTPTSTGAEGNRSIVETDIRFVGADDAPEGFDAGTAQTAFYLQNLYEEESDEPTGYQLYAWTTDMADDGGTNHWEAIGAPFGSTFADSWHKVQIVIDYREANPYLHVAVDGTEVTGDNVVAANKTDTKTTGKVTAVSFKGTGAIDNFTGTRLFTDFAEYNFTAQIYKDGAPDATVTGSSTAVVHTYAGDYDDDTYAAAFTGLPTADFAFDEHDEIVVTYAMSSVVVVDLSTGEETTYAYNFDKTNYSFTPVGTACPSLAFAQDGMTFTLSPLTYGATSNSIIAKVNYRTLDAYYANESITVGETTVVNPTFVKPADCPVAFSNVYPAATNVNETAYVLSSVKVAGGATVAFANDQATVSFSVADQLPADTTYVEATYVAGTYVAAAVEWSFDSSTGIGTFVPKTFTVSFTWEGGSTSDTYYYGDTPVVPADPADYVSGGATYGFTGWSPAVVDVVADATYVAQYEMTSAPKATVIRIADGSTESFGSLADALEAAVAGDTVKLLDNAVVDTTVSISKDLVLDLGGYYVSNTVVRSGEPLARTLQANTGNVVVTNGTVYGRVNCYDDSTLTIAANTTVEGYVLVWGDGTYGEAGCKTPTLNVYGTIDGGSDVVLFNGNGDTSKPNINVFPGAVLETDCTGYAITLREANFTMTGGTIDADWGIFATNATIAVSGGTFDVGKRAIDADYGTAVTISGGAINAEDSGIGLWNGSSLTMTGGSITADSFGVFNNGMEKTGTTMAISGGTITSTNSTACGIYQAGKGSLTLSGTAVVSGADAVEVRAGTVQVLSNAQLIATAPYSAPTSNGGGSSGHGGVALLVSQHTTTNAVSATVSGGTLQGAVAFEEATVESNADPTVVSGEISGGTILGDVLSEDIDDLIPSDSEALFADADAEGVEDGYGLQEDPENPGLYKVVKTYVVTYANYDGAALQVTTNFVNETTPAYAGATPVKPSDSQYDYTFTGWSPAVAETVAADATYTAQFSRKENGTVIVITDAGATTNYFATLQAALDSVKENNLQQANIELLADASITISRNGNVLGGNSTTNITINGNDHELHVVRDGTWAQFNTANGATLVLEDVDLTSEFTGTQTGWVGDTLQNPNHNIAFNCDVELKNVDSDTALSFWKDADLDTVTIAETVDVYSIWIHTTASNIAIKDLVVDSPNGRGIKVDDSFVKYAGTPSASTAISIDGASFTTKNRKSAVLVRSAYPIDITTAGTIDISNVPADTQHLVWVDVDASENFGLVTFNGAQSGLGVEGGASSYAASLTTNAWIAGYYKVLADAVEVATAADTVTLLKDSAETFTVSKPLTITRNGFSADGVTAGEGYERTDTAETYVFAEEPTGTVIVITDAGATTNYYATLQAAVDAAPAGATVVLLADNEASRVTVEKNLVIDLGGHTYTGRLSMFDGNVVVTNGTVAGRFDVYDSSVVTLAANTTVDGYVIVWGDGVYGEAGCKTPTFNLYGTVRNNDPAADQYAISTSSDDDSRPVVNIYEGAVVETIWAGVGIRNGASLNMTGGSITAGEFGIYNNGSDTTPTTINVSGGTVTSTNEVNTACGIYQAGPGTLTISGSAVVSGPDAVEVRAGSVQVLDNAQLVATMPYTQPASNGNGNSGHGGVALLVSQHTTAQAVSAAVDGGTLTGEVAFQEATVETQNNPSLVTGAINAGAIDGEVLSEDIDDLIPSDSEALFADADAEGVEEGYGLKEDPTHPGLYVVTKTYVVVYANYNGAALQTTTNFVDDATPAYAGATPTKDEDEDYTYAFADAWSPTPDATVTSNATYVAQFTATPKQAEEEHIGAKSDDGFVILAPADDDYDTTKPLTFAAPDLTAGTVDISASMIWPDGVTSTTLTLVYKKSLLGPEFTAQVTVAKKGEDSATVTMPDFSGEDTIFFIGFRNEAGVED